MTGDGLAAAPRRAADDRTLTPDGTTAPITRAGHAARIGLVMTIAAALLGWLAAHTDILFADGLRYIAQARALDRGNLTEAFHKAVDHPVYPIAVVAVHRTLGGNDPEDWQLAAQLASIATAVLLVFPFYLISLELFGARAALPASLLFFAVPLTGHVFADTLSESTFLLFWAWGLWGALRFLKGGGLCWLPLVVVASGLAYLSRPEGLLLPSALVGTLILSPRWVAGGLGRRGLVVVAVLVAGSAGLVGPYVAIKGGLGTKPSVARLLGTAPRSAAHAVERQRPLDPTQSKSRTYVLAAKSVAKAVTEAVTLPLLCLAVVGLASIRRGGLPSRGWTLLAVITVASVLALIRLHATGGYCSPRHALILALMIVPAAAAGLERLTEDAVGLALRSNLLSGGRAATVRSGLVAIAVALLALVHTPEILAPVNEGMRGYRDAGRWLAGHSGDDSRVVDVTGWSQFYCGHPGYTFENLVAAPADPSARWVVVREAHLRGPWDYCQRLSALVEGLSPVEEFQGATRRRTTKVLVFDRRARLARAADHPSSSARR